MDDCIKFRLRKKERSCQEHLIICSPIMDQYLIKDSVISYCFHIVITNSNLSQWLATF